MKAFKSQEGKEAVLAYYDMLLAKMAIPYEKLSINTGFGPTFVLAAGEADNPPIILLHGSSMNSAMWIGDMQKLCLNYRVYAPDLPGEPGRSNEEQLPFDTEAYTDWLLDLMKGLSLDQAIIGGASLGAWLALKFAVRHLEKVSKLVLLCPAGVGSQNHEFKEIALSLLLKGEEGINELFRKINGDKPIPEIILNYQKLIAMSFNSRQEPIPLFADDELRRLTMPSILFVGGKDIMLKSEETAERFSRLVPHARIVVLPDHGHSLKGLADDISDFLQNS